MPPSPVPLPPPRRAAPASTARAPYEWPRVARGIKYDVLGRCFRNRDGNAAEAIHDAFVWSVARLTAPGMAERPPYLARGGPKLKALQPFELRVRGPVVGNGPAPAPPPGPAPPPPSGGGGAGAGLPAVAPADGAHAHSQRGENILRPLARSGSESARTRGTGQNYPPNGRRGEAGI